MGISEALAESQFQHAYEQSLFIARNYKPEKKIYRNNKFLSFLTKIAFGTSDCWYWIGSRNKQGYGCFNGVKAHRYSWQVFNNQTIPKKMCVLHKCDITSCVNPNHLIIDTQKQNIQDMLIKKRHRVNPLYGPLNKMCKFSTETINNIRTDYKTGKYKQSELSVKYGVSRMQINRIVHNKLRIKG